MERRIDLSNLDLDLAAEAIEGRRNGWTEWGLTVHPMTWMDMDASWPRPLVTERSEVRAPMSLGLRLEGPERAEAEVVLYAGGWADVLVAAPRSESEQVSQEYIELEAADELVKLLDRVVAVMIGQAP